MSSRLVFIIINFLTFIYRCIKTSISLDNQPLFYVFINDGEFIYYNKLKKTTYKQMKFAISALLGLVSVQAITLN